MLNYQSVNKQMELYSATFCWLIHADATLKSRLNPQFLLVNFHMVVA